MRHLAYILFLSTFLCTCVSAQKAFPMLTESQRITHLERRADTSSWDREMLSQDLEDISFFNDVKPMLPGIFPEPAYDLVGENSFDGVFSDGTIWKRDTIGGKAVGALSFGVGDNAWNRPFMGQDTNQVFFTLVTVIDTLDEEGYPVMTSLVYSRNNPDVLGEAAIRNTVSTVECIAFITAENERFAIVNMRLFNLKYGDVIVIVPQQDGSFRSLQIKEAPRSKSTNNPFIRKNVLRRPEVIALLTAEGVI